MNKKIFITTAPLSLIALAFFLSSCSGTAVSNTANNSVTNQPPVISNVSTPMNMNSPVSNSVAMNVNGASMTNTGNSAGANVNRKAVPPVKEPTPQIGSGASDLLLFTQARSALSSDRELQTAVIIEVKEGKITLSGKVPNAQQKAKAEQLISAVNGVKSLQNNLTVSK